MTNSDGKDPPIETANFIAGVNVVDIGDLRVARGLSRRPFSSCQHRQMSYDKDERRIWCRDCETNVEAFDAFLLIVEHFDSARKDIERRSADVKAAEEHALISLAAREVDKVWRGRRMVPLCPVCSSGLFPEDFKNGSSASGRSYAAARRKAANRPVPGFVANKDAEP